MGQVQRIMIIGGPGSGKSTLARKLGQKSGLPVVHLDKLYWRPGWTNVSNEEMTEATTLAARQDRWIIDGNYSRTYPYRVSRAHLIVFLDMPRGLRLRRILWRVATSFGRTRPDMGEGCPERFDREFWDYAKNYDRDIRPRQAKLITDCHARGYPRCVILRNPAAVAWFVNSYATRFARLDTSGGGLGLDL